MDPERLIDLTLNALDRLRRSFQLERYCYLIASIISFAVMTGWVIMAIRTGQVSVETAGIIFGANSFFTAGSVGMTYFYQKGFSLIEFLVRSAIAAPAPAVAAPPTPAPAIPSNP